MDEQRALLDMLMGRARDVPEELKSSVKEISFHDREVCKYFLCGICPYLLFNATKSDLGRCPKKICDNSDALELRQKYARVPQNEKDLDGYEYELMKHLEDLVHSCDLRIERNKRRSEKETAISEENLQKIAAIEKQIAIFSEECQTAVDKDDIDVAHVSISLLQFVS